MKQKGGERRVSGGTEGGGVERKVTKKWLKHSF